MLVCFTQVTMSSSRLLFTLPAIFLVLLPLRHTCIANAVNNTLCTSSCGNIHDISYPFRLNTDPEFCGNKNYELACENNRAVLEYNYSAKYYVQGINYSDFTIRLVDADVKEEDYCSVPRHSLPLNLLSFPYTDFQFSDVPSNGFEFTSLVFISCANPVNSSFCVDSSTCRNSRYNSSSPSSTLNGYSCVMVGYSGVLEMADSCHVELIYAAGMLPDTVVSNISYKDIHDGMVYGFQLSWYRACCGIFKANRSCNINDVVARNCYPESKNALYSIINFFNVFVDNALMFVLSAGKHSSYEFTGSESDLRVSLVNTLMYAPYYDRQFEYVLNRNVSQWFRYSTEFLRHVPVFLVLYHSSLILCGSPFIMALLIYKWRRRHLSVYDNIEEFLHEQNNFMPIRYSYSEIKKMTKGFKDKLGEGGYGSVYKGKLRSGYFAAIKMLGNSKTNGKEFINEVATIGRIHHVNIIKLIGFCVEGSKRALVYEFMPNGSLDKYIFPHNEVHTPISVEKMYEICLGVACGIEYLHRGCDIQILHFDIKPHNILLDDKFIPKISDFGLAKLCETNNNIVSLTAIRGTIGYMAPELFYRSIGDISYKVDVYSFGMMLMEMGGRRKNLNTLVKNSSQLYFPLWVHDQFSQGKDIELEDVIGNDNKIAKKMIIIALWCIQLKPNDRPSMYKVLEMLEGEVERLELPPRPMFGPLETTYDKAGSTTNATELTCSSSNYVNSFSLAIQSS